MPGPSIVAAQLCGLFFGSMFYGIYLVTLGIAVRVILTTDYRWKRRSEIKWLTLVVSVILFLNGTLDLALALYGNIHAFVFAGADGAAYVFLHASGWENVLKTMAVGTQSITGDAILIYRCWVVYHRSWRLVVVPLILWLGTLVANGRMIWIQASLVTRELITAKLILPWGMTFWALTITANSLTTALIVWRIRRVDKEVQEFRLPPEALHHAPPTALSRVVRCMIESGLLYTVAAVLTFATFAARSSLVYVASVIELHSVGIAFNLIIIRLGQTGTDSSIGLQTRDAITSIRFGHGETINTIPPIPTVPDVDQDTLALPHLEKWNSLLPSGTETSTTSGSS
ncbi:hypothetical protein C8J57DRAFT_1295516 [Mycena rebaudengoi]|nr:hypothetical protein C8J57DRAFT_1295516 [Mycena rebaudengoi]